MNVKVKLQDVPITPFDLSLFQRQMEQELKDLFPFSSLDLFFANESSDLDELIERIPFSSRQKMRARSHLAERRPFWDRVLHQALLPLEHGNGSSLVICRITGMPKTIGTEEGLWFLGLARHVLEATLKEKKAQALYMEEKGVPQYLTLFFREGDTEGKDIVELSFYKKNEPPIDHVEEIVKRSFCAKEVSFCGRINDSSWFVAKGPSKRRIETGVKACVSSLRQGGNTLRSFSLYDGVCGIDEILGLKRFAKGLGAAVFSATSVRNLMKELGMAKDFKLHATTKLPSKASMGAFFLLGSNKAQERARRIMEERGLVQEVSEKALFAVAPVRNRQGGLFALEETCKDIFNVIKEETGDESLTAGFASPFQPFVTRKGLFYSCLLAFYHAKLLGPGKMAIFDHVTCNVHGDILFSWGDLSGAIRCYRRGLMLKKDDENLLNSLGACLADASRLSEAQGLFERVLNTNPKSIMALYNLSGVHLRRGRLEKAAKALEKAARQNGSDTAILTRLLDVYIKMGEFDKAYEISKRLTGSGAATRGWLLKLCARAAFETRNWQEAKELFKKCIERMPEDRESLLLLAKGFFTFEGDAETANVLLRQLDIEKCADDNLEKEAKALSLLIHEATCSKVEGNGLDNLRVKVLDKQGI